MLCTIAALAAITPVQAADTLSSADREAGLQYLDQTRDRLVAAVSGLSESQATFKSGDDRWSIAQIVEHIAITEEFLLRMVQDNVMKAPAGAPDRNVKDVDALVKKAISSRDVRVKAPEQVQPSASAPLQESLERFLAARNKTNEFLKSTAGLRDHVAESPLQKPLDAYQWLIYIPAHCERHTAQIDEVKASAGYPAK